MVIKFVNVLYFLDQCSAFNNNNIHISYMMIVYSICYSAYCFPILKSKACTDTQRFFGFLHFSQVWICPYFEVRNRVLINIMCK